MKLDQLINKKENIEQIIEQHSEVLSERELNHLNEALWEIEHEISKYIN